MHSYGKNLRSFLKGSSSLLLAAAAFASAAAADMALAGPAMAQAGTGQDSGVETVVVTARFRPESAQKVGVTLNELDADKIRALNIASVADLAAFTPLNITNRGPNQNATDIRGISNLVAVGSGTDPLPVPTAVGNYVDDVPINVLFGTQLDVRSFDLHNIEVLSGPQGTLYGESSEGGTVRYQTNDPNLDTFGGTIEVMGRATTDGGADVSPRGAVDIPLIAGQVGVRLVVDDENFGGFINNSTDGGKDINANHFLNVHGVLLAKPDDKLTVRIAVTHEAGDMGALWAVTGDPSKLQMSYPDSKDFIHDDYTLISGKVNYDFGPFALSSISGWFDRDTHRSLFDMAVGSVVGLPFGRDVDQMSTRQFTQELRFISEWDSAVQLTGGLYYKNVDAGIPFVNFFVPDAFGPGVPFQLFQDSTLKETGVQYAAYGEATWSILDNLKLIGGARWFNEKITAHETPGTFEGIPIPIVNKSVSISALLPKASIEYTPTDDVLLYATYSTGARNGNINSASTLALLQVLGVNVGPLATYKDDRVTAYEVGIKTKLLDDRLTANFAGFYDHWSRLQLPVDPGVGLGLITNVGAAHTAGVDANIDYAPTENLTIFATADYLVAETDEPIETRLVAPIATLPKGSKIPFAPDFKFAVGTQYHDTIGDSGFQYALRASYTYTGNYNNDTGPAIVPNTRLGDFGFLNLGATLIRDDWSADFAIDNVTDEIAIQTTDTTNLAPSPQVFYVNASRTYRLTLRYNF